MDYVEAEGNSIDQAIEQALEQLGVTREKAEIEILCNTTRGLFGIGGRKARVRATIRRELTLTEVDTPRDEPETSEVPEEEPVATEVAEETLVRRDAALSKVSPDTGAEPAETQTEKAALEGARDTLQEIVGLMQVEAKVEIADTERLLISGDKRGVLIGRRGQTLDALEYVLNRMVTRVDSAGRITIDSEDYRERRRQSLEALAKRLAKRVHRRGKPVSLNPMTPRDRRIIHLALQGDSSLVTRSTGEGYFRRLVIAPAGSRAGGRQKAQRRETELQE